MDNVISERFEDESIQNVYASVVKDMKGKSISELFHVIKEHIVSKINLMNIAKKKDAEIQVLTIANHELSKINQEHAKVNHKLSKTNKDLTKTIQELTKTNQELTKAKQELTKANHQRPLTEDEKKQLNQESKERYEEIINIQTEGPVNIPEDLREWCEQRLLDIKQTLRGVA